MPLWPDWWASISHALRIVDFRGVRHWQVVTSHCETYSTLFYKPVKFDWYDSCMFYKLVIRSCTGFTSCLLCLWNTQSPHDSCLYLVKLRHNH